MTTETRRDGTVQLADWWEDLLWPKVLSGAALGLRPSRIGLAFFGMIFGLLVIQLGLWVDGKIGSPGYPMPWTRPAGPEGTLMPIWNWFVGVPVAYLRGLPATTILFVVVIYPFWLVIVGAISRMVAVEFSRGEFLTWTEGMAFSLSRWRSLIGATAGPLLVVWCIALALASAGWVLFSWTGMTIAGSSVGLLGAALYGLALVLGIVASLVGLVYIVGHNLLVPAVVCDGADAIDAIQRGYAYTLDRPVRLIVYLILACLGLAFVLLVASIVVGGGIGIALAGTGSWSGDKAREVLLHGTMRAFPFLPSWQPQTPHIAGRLTERTAWLVSLWTMIPVAGLFACYISCAVASMTVVYLAIRRVCDGQDTAEIWMPGMIEGVMTESLRGRAMAAGTQSAVAVQAEREEVEEP